MSETQSSATLHFLCGKIASGKSTLAQQLVRGQQAVLLSEDTWLAALYPDKSHSWLIILKKAVC